MMPEAFSVTAIIACIILLISGWGSYIIHSSNMKRSYLIFGMLAYVLLYPFSINGCIVQSITVSGAILPSLLVVYCMFAVKGWQHKILLLLKGVSIGSSVAGAVIGINQLIAIPTEHLYWITVVLITCSSIIACRSFLSRWGTIIFAVETASIWMDMCVSYVPTEHLVIGSPSTQAMLVVSSIGVWLMTSIVYEAKHLWTTGQVTLVHSWMKRT